jgi:hypothetical protein
LVELASLFREEVVLPLGMLLISLNMLDVNRPLQARLDATRADYHV